MTRKIIRFCIVHEGYKETAVRKVQDLLSEGWEPFGSPCAIGPSGDVAQAMVRYAEPEASAGLVSLRKEYHERLIEARTALRELAARLLEPCPKLQFQIHAWHRPAGADIVRCQFCGTSVNVGEFGL